MTTDNESLDNGKGVYAENKQSGVPVDLAAAVETALFVLASLALPEPGELTITYVTPAEMTSINGAYRDKEEPTDVLSFAAGETAGGPAFVSNVAILGDIVICPEVVKAEAERRSAELEESMREVLIHGLLHLAGYNHVGDRGARAMLALQEDLLKRSGSDARDAG